MNGFLVLSGSLFSFLIIGFVSSYSPKPNRFHTVPRLFLLYFRFAVSMVRPPSGHPRDIAAVRIIVLPVIYSWP